MDAEVEKNVLLLKYINGAVPKVFKTLLDTAPSSFIYIFYNIPTKLQLSISCFFL